MSSLRLIALVAVLAIPGSAPAAESDEFGQVWDHLKRLSGTWERQVTANAYYTTNIELFFEDEDNIELRFRGTTAGEQGEWQVHRMRRLTTRAYE